jgi:hypothetical protein
MKKPRQPRQKPRVKPRVKPAWLSQNHGNHGSGPSYACVRAREQSVYMSLARVYTYRGFRGVSGFKDLQRFCRGFWRGFPQFTRGFVFYPQQRG